MPKCPRKRSLAANALLAILLVAAGCSALPTAPVPDREPTVPATASATPAGESELLGIPLSLPLPKLPPVPVVEQTLERIVHVAGLAGAEIEVGDVTVTVPPHAIEGDAEIRVTVPDSTKLECHLEIFPADKNHFAQPVVLEFDASAAQDVRTFSIFWFDEDARQWVPIPCTVDNRTKRVRAELPHFSRYKCEDELQGKAGW